MYLYDLLDSIRIWSMTPHHVFFVVEYINVCFYSYLKLVLYKLGYVPSVPKRLEIGLKHVKI